MSTIPMREMWSDVSRFVSAELLEVINSNAVVSNQEACLPAECLQGLKERKLFSCMIQEELGGGGASLSECAAILHRIGRLDAGLAIGLTMHFITAAHIDRMHRKGFQDLSEILLKIVSDQCIACSAGSEPNLGGAVAKSSFVTVRCKDGYLISGRKSPVSFSRLGEYAHIGFPDPEGKNERLLEALVPIKVGGVTVQRSWDTLGARSSESHTAVFDNYYVPDHLVLRTPPDHYQEMLAAMITWYCTLLTAAYLGTVQAVADKARSILISTNLYSKQAPRGSLPSFQRAFGDVHAKISLLSEACVSIASQASDPEFRFESILASSLSLRHVATDICMDAVFKLAELVGASAYGNSHFVSRAMRDIHALAFHVPNRIMCQEMIGQILLGMQPKLDYQDRADRAANG